MRGWFFRNPTILRVMLAASLAAAVVPAILCLVEISSLRNEVVLVEKSTVDAFQARDLADKASQSLFNFTAGTLDLDISERLALLQQTDALLRTLGDAVEAAEGLTQELLSRDDQTRLRGAINGLIHSWSEIREKASQEITSAEKSFHFTMMFENAKVAREILVQLEASAGRTAEIAMLSSLRHAKDVGFYLLVALGIGGCVTTLAIVGNHRYAQETTCANRGLERALAEIRERDLTLRTQNERFQTALGNMSQGLCMFDRDQRLIVCNRRFGEIYRLDESLMRPGTSLRRLLKHRAETGAYPAGGRDRFVKERLALMALEEPFSDTIETVDGRVLQIVHQPMPNGGWVDTHEDISDRKQAEAQIAHMAHHDALTGLPNRLLFREQMEQALGHVRRGGTLSVFCLDLDHFKAVNDTLGHPVGDALLKAVAARLAGCVRETDTVARLGGDEFAVVQVGADCPHQATALADRIIEALSAPYDIGGHQVVTGTSIGIAVAPNDGDDPDRLLKAADMALYRAKHDGRGTFRFFEAEMDSRMQARRALELDLRKALQNGDFEVHYQPLVNIAENRVSGFEALLRWPHAERGPVSPAEFIPLAEEIGLINPIGAWVLRQACSDAAHWPGDVRLAVNLSPVQFQSRTLVLDVISALGDSGLPANRLELEITEAVMLQDTETTLATLHQLRALGVRISMDDFGTGYSSLSYLRKFPFDKIKIDQSFIRDLAQQDDSVAIVRAVTSLGASLGIATTAEGVETLEQLTQLRSEGCTEVQGWLFSPARPAHELLGLMAHIAERCRAAA